MDESKMKRKLIYAIIFISIFLMSSASMVSPVQGYEPPDIPAEAKGMTLDDTEVTVYDEDGLEDSLGKGFDIKDIKAGDADIVGARSQMKILDWETDEDLIAYEEDYSYGPLVAENHDLVVQLLASLADNGTAGKYPMGTAYGPYGPLAFIANYSVWNATTWGSIASKTVAGAAQANLTGAIINLAGLFGTGLRSFADIITTWGESYDGTIVEREIWDFLDPAEEFDPNDPDVDDDEVPYLLDPRDWANSYYNMRGYSNELYGALDGVQQYWGAKTGWWATLAGGCAKLLGMDPTPWAAYEDVNASIYEQVINLKGDVKVAPPGSGGVLSEIPLWQFVLGAITTPSNLSDMLSIPAAYGDYSYGTDYVLGLWGFLDGIVETTRNSFKALLPDKFGFLFNQLEAGQPCCGPAADFIKRAVKEFNIRGGPYKIPFIQYGKDLDNNGEVSVVPINTFSPNTGADLGGETIYIYAEVDVEVDDAGTVTVGIEYKDGQLDPKDVLSGETVKDSDELDDWEWVFPKASDAPTQIKDGNTILYETTPMAGPIPGYEIPVLIGVSLVSVIGLIYVIMRKRKK